MLNHTTEQRATDDGLVPSHPEKLRAEGYAQANALGMAIIRRKPANDSTILHSDHGSQYTSWAFGQRLRVGRVSGSGRGC